MIIYGNWCLLIFTFSDINCNWPKNAKKHSRRYIVKDPTVIITSLVKMSTSANAWQAIGSLNESDQDSAMSEFPVCQSLQAGSSNTTSSSSCQLSFSINRLLGDTLSLPQHGYSNLQLADTLPDPETLGSSAICNVEPMQADVMFCNENTC